MDVTLQGEKDEIKPKSDWRSFWLLFSFQAQNAFNDKTAQFLLIPLAAWLHAQSGKAGADNMSSLLGALIVLPYIVFSPVVGWLSDRYSKVFIVRLAAIMQVFVLSGMCAALYARSINWAVFAFFLLAVQSTILSPAKKGLVKEQVGEQKLGMASGLLEMGSILAILVGQIVTSWWFDQRLQGSNNGWEASHFPILVVAVASLPALLVAQFIRPTPALSRRPYEARIWIEHFYQLRELWGDRILRLSGFGVAFFWFFGGFLILLFSQLAQETSAGGSGFGSYLAQLNIAASGGMIVGACLAAFVCRKGIELGLVPIGGMVMSVAIALASRAQGMNLMIILGCAGAGAAVYLVPLNALIQQKCEPERRGSILAAINLQDCFAGLLAVILQLICSKVLSVSGQFLVLSVLCLVATALCFSLTAQALVRFVLARLLRLVYRVDSLQVENLPKKGGVLLVPNHVSYADAFFISLASPRPVRFLIAEEFIKVKWMRWFLDLFDVVPISTKKAKEAIRVAAETLEAGDLVCIFPEGQLTRTGQINPLKSGYRLIANKAKCPIIPAYMDGAWGSIFSFEGGRYFRKRPRALRYGLRVAFGAAHEAAQLDEGNLMREFENLSQVALESMRPEISQDWMEKGFEKLGSKIVLQCGAEQWSGSEMAEFCRHLEAIPSMLIGLRLLLEQMSSDEEGRLLLWWNASQLLRVHGLQRNAGLDYGVEAGEAWHAVLGLIYPLLAECVVSVHFNPKTWNSSQNTQGVAASAWLQGIDEVKEGRVEFAMVTEPTNNLGLRRPLWVGGKWQRVLAMGLRDAKLPVKDFPDQIGYLEGSLGRLLPGVRRQAGGVILPGGEYVSLPRGCDLNADGWIFAQTPSVLAEQ